MRNRSGDSAERRPALRRAAARTLSRALYSAARQPPRTNRPARTRTRPTRRPVVPRCAGLAVAVPQGPIGLRRSPTRARRQTVWTRCADFVMAVRSRSTAGLLYGNAAAGGGVGKFEGVLGVSQGSRRASRGGKLDDSLTESDEAAGLLTASSATMPMKRTSARRGFGAGIARTSVGTVRNGASRSDGWSLRGRSES